MNAATPRLPPLAWGELSAEQQEELRPYGEGGALHNVHRVFIRNLKMFRRHGPFSDYIMRRSSLSARHREMAIIRIGWLNRSPYECAHHHRLGLEAGLTSAELSRLAEGPEASGWSEVDRLVLEAVDELKADANLTDATYAALSRHFDDHQLIDLVFTVGAYAMISTALNVFGVPLEDGVPAFPPFETAAV
ncbi:MAG TPA: carboxymuconolactone decarboxylase family protein [Caulobacteraceae bacterium]